MNIAQDIGNYILEKHLAGDHRGFNGDTPLLELGILDSKGMLDLVYFLEKQFSITVEDDEFIPEYFFSVSRIQMFVEEKLKSTCHMER